ncbi:MAG: hypothetical protein U9R24_01285 [Thermodesulfobacteriota bacterium]|nr:hypothetical protein [Thermodesulfobacteriota bacterium]
MTEASQLALHGLRSLSMLKWYVIPLLAFVFYIYTFEMKKAWSSGSWNAIFAGVTIFGMDFINETWNGWVFHLTQRSAVWTTPGDTALRTMVGWNIEIMFMFAILGIIFYNTVFEDRRIKILGIPNWWFWAIVYAAFCVFVEVILNVGGHLVWEYPWWNKSFGGIWLIYFFGYFHFFVAAIIVMSLKTIKAKAVMVSIIYAIAIVGNVIGLGILGWVY